MYLVFVVPSDSLCELNLCSNKFLLGQSTLHTFVIESFPSNSGFFSKVNSREIGVDFTNTSAFQRLLSCKSKNNQTIN